MIPHPEYFLIAVNPKHWPYGQDISRFVFGFLSRAERDIAYAQTKRWHPDLFFFAYNVRYRGYVT